jgi:anti-sigma factor (TIGR02949 family)
MPVFTCESAQEQLYDYLDHELGADEEGAVRRHLATCEACAARFRFEKEWLTTIRARCRPRQAPESLRRRIAQRIRCLA